MSQLVLEVEKAVKTAAAHGPSELRHIDYLDGWRGLAIALVLQSHFLAIGGFNSGRLGVNVFFVLSGLLMGRILFIKRVPLGTFYKRRISRILPVFVAFVAIVYGAAYVLHHEERHYFMYTLTFTRAYLPAAASFWRSDIPIGHLWSLNVEEHCYLFLGLFTLITCLRGRDGPALLAVGTLCVAIHFIYMALPAEALPVRLLERKRPPATCCSPRATCWYAGDSPPSFHPGCPWRRWRRRSDATRRSLPGGRDPPVAISAGVRRESSRPIPAAGSAGCFRLRHCACWASGRIRSTCGTGSSSSTTTLGRTDKRLPSSYPLA